MFYARKLVLEAAVENPTIVVLTDRNDLDERLFCARSPQNARDRAELRELFKYGLNGTAGGARRTRAPRRRA